jgi:hypothetical protein
MDNRLGIFYTKAQSQHQINGRQSLPVKFERLLSKGNSKSGSASLEERPYGLEDENSSYLSSGETLLKRQRSLDFKTLEVSHEID